MELNKKQLSFILDCIQQYEGYGEFMTTNGHQLAESEVDELISMVEEELNSNPELQKEPEDACQDYCKSTEVDSNKPKYAPTAKELRNLWDVCNSPSVFARAIIAECYEHLKNGHKGT